ncbi:Uncharacterized conserved protein [Anaerocolumna jejuensis DSM 15929]|uniref:Uncharacterized conserved protein n=1 Tax=Anaerocolumna jejuensis DSM 15929 TaxID=1121322 RepID=A0A1M7AL02_9FIRM|nr:hypothetical protein [Anaerocolumna jejuensis]SHL43186.1 Uncharacterized conserved protein [Anaerocolumna jejuensis DSM 15929]
MRKVKKVFTAVLIMTMIAANLAGGTAVKATADSGNGISIVYADSVNDINGVPGETVHVKLPIKAVGGYLAQPRITVVTEGKPYKVENVALTGDGFSSDNPPIGINAGKLYIEFDLAVKETAKIGITKLEVKVDALYSTDTGYSSATYTLPSLNFIISDEIEPAQLTVDNVNYDNATIGKSIDLNFTIRNEGKITARNAYFSIDDKSFDETKISPRYSKLEQKIGKSGTLKGGEIYNVKLPLKIQSDATAGLKKLTVTMKYKDEDGNVTTDTSQVYITVTANTEAPVIEIVSTKYASELVAGDKFNMVVTIRNTGKSPARDIQVSIDGLGSEGFLPGYTGKTIAVDKLAVNGKTDVKIPLIVSQNAKVGLKEVPITIAYTDETKTPFNTKTSVYLSVEATEGVDESGKPNIVITNVTQSPDAPNAGARVNVSFDMENKSKVDISDVKISLATATGDVFAPLSSEPYYYIDSIKGGNKARVNMSLKASDSIPEGTSSVALKYSYVANGKTSADETANLYILNVQNNGAGSSKPKLIISNFSASEEKLVAGTTFDFTFEIKNTHPSMSARNIKVTLSQTDNIFMVDNGSNTFYISKISAGEKIKKTLKIRVKSDAVTKAYPLDVTMDYDYEGAKANPTTGQIGETAKETINLQAAENTRAVVDNIVVGSYDAPVVNQPCTITFAFYNMGKSTLSNVKATVSGDYKLSTGDMLFVGNVEAGGQQTPELEAIPSVEGEAKGVLTVTFEDSTGQEVKITKDFTGSIQAAYTPDPGAAGNPDGNVAQAKKAILPIWIFVIIQVVILGVGIATARKIKINLYKKKLRKIEEAD